MNHCAKGSGEKWRWETNGPEVIRTCQTESNDLPSIQVAIAGVTLASVEEDKSEATMRRSSLRERDSDCLREDGMRRRTCAPIAEDHDYLYEEGDSIASWQHYEQSAVENTRELLEDPSRDSIVETDSWYMTSRSLAHKFSVVGNLRKRSVREVDGNGVGADTARGDSVNGDGCGGLTGGDGGGGVTREGGQAAGELMLVLLILPR